MDNVNIKTLNALYESLAVDEKAQCMQNRESSSTNPESNFCIQCCYFPCIPEEFKLLPKKPNAGFTSWKEDNEEKRGKEEDDSND